MEQEFCEKTQDGANKSIREGTEIFEERLGHGKGSIGEITKRKMMMKEDRNVR